MEWTSFSIGAGIVIGLVTLVSIARFIGQQWKIGRILNSLARDILSGKWPHIVPLLPSLDPYDVADAVSRARAHIRLQGLEERVRSVAQLIRFEHTLRKLCFYDMLRYTDQTVGLVKDAISSTTDPDLPDLLDAIADTGWTRERLYWDPSYWSYIFEFLVRQKREMALFRTHPDDALGLKNDAPFWHRIRIYLWHMRRENPDVWDSLARVVAELGLLQCLKDMYQDNEAIPSVRLEKVFEFYAKQSADFEPLERLEVCRLLKRWSDIARLIPLLEEKGEQLEKERLAYLGALRDEGQLPLLLGMQPIKQ